MSAEDASSSGGRALVFHHDDQGTDEREWQTAEGWTGLARQSLPDELDRLVVLVPHPDDETLAVGGVLHLAGRLGWAVDVLIATDGAASHPASPTHPEERLRVVRAGEVRAAVAELDPRARVHLLGLPDGQLAEHRSQLVETVVDVVRDGGRTLLISTWRADGHPDHEAAAQAAAVVAWRTDASLWQAPIWAWMWASPDTFPWAGAHRVELSAGTREAKQRALAQHRSQHAPLSPEPGDEALLSASFLSHFERGAELFWACEPDRSTPFDQLHTEQADPWQTHTSDYEERKRSVILASLPRQRYRRALEIGCSVGVLSHDLAGRCEELVAVDESAVALDRARTLLAGLCHVSLVRGDLPEDWPAGELDLVVLSETGYYLSPARLDRLLARVEETVAPDGQLLTCHWRHEIRGWPLDGAGVREQIQRRLGWPQLVQHLDEDFELCVWGRAPTHR